MSKTREKLSFKMCWNKVDNRHIRGNYNLREHQQLHSTLKTTKQKRIGLARLG